MKELLLVDDEPSVVRALSASLRRVRDRYHVRVAIGAEEAAEAMLVTPADIVVTDMRMPGADGEALLRTLQATWPSTVRIVLSGWAEPSASRRVAMLAHLFLSKPIESEQLVARLDGVSAVIDRLQRPELRSLVGRLRRLPVLSRTSRVLRALLSEPEVTASQVAAVVKQSPSLTAKVLHLGNSAFFAAGAQVTSVERAVTVIGTETLHALVIAADIFAETPRGAPVGDAMLRLQLRALFAARIARALTPRRTRNPDAWTAAILHEIGLVVMMSEGTDLLHELTERVHAHGERIEEAEHALWGATHADVGAYLLGLWGFEWDVIQAVGGHLALPGDVTPVDTAGVTALTAALAAEAFPLWPHAPESRGIPPVAAGDTAAAELHARWRELARFELDDFSGLSDELSGS